MNRFGLGGGGGNARLQRNIYRNPTGIADGHGGIIPLADLDQRVNLISKPSALLLDLPNVAVTTSSATATRDSSVTRWSGATLKVTPSGTPGQIRKGSLALSLDPVDQLLTVDVYIPAIVTGTTVINVSLFNTSGWSANYTTWGFNVNAIRQGWNALKCWCGDTAGTVGSGTLGAGSSKVVGGTGFNPASPIGYFEINIDNGIGKDFYFDGLRKGSKSIPVLVMGFDATGASNDDDIYTKIGGVADFLAANNIRGYFTNTYIYDMLYAGGADDLRKDILYNKYGWDALPHFWNHGGSYPGTSITATGASRASNVVTFTKAAHGIPIGTIFYGAISGATPTDMNGLQLITVTSTSAMTYTAAGADGSATGTVVLKTYTADVISADNATTRAILRHEIVDLVRLMRARRWNRALHIGAYPNNSVGELAVHQAICAEAGIKFFRGISGRSARITEFGVDNPLNFGSVEMGSGTTATSLQNVIDALTGAMGRGDHLWTYGHYIRDEALDSGVDINYAPGQNGNPAAPAGGDGGWWYFGQLKKFVSETVVPLVQAGQLRVMTPSEWAANLGNIDGAR